MGLKRLILLAAAISLLALWGCSSSMDSGSDDGGELTLQEIIDAAGEYVGPARCIDCHSNFSWSGEDVQDYLEGPHVIHSDHINAESEDVCLGCHDPLHSGRLVEGYINPDDVPDEGLAAVTCENCHGSGIDHYGVGPIPNPTPGPDACGQCHNDKWETIPEAEGHLTYHPEGNNIYNDYEGSPHNNIHTGAPCAKCHTDQGAHLYKDYDTYESLATVTEVDDPQPIQCRTCHNPHNPEELLEKEQNSGYPDYELTASAEFATCTNCHQRPDAQITLETPGDPNSEVVIKTLPGSTSSDGASGDLIYHAARFTRVISSTHYDNPETDDSIEGYVVDPTSERACRNCHNVHSADITINEQWAESGHGGDILEAKKQYVIDNGGECVNASDETIPCVPGDYTQEIDDHSIVNVSLYRAGGTGEGPWNAYPWSATNDTLYFGTYNIMECQQCHTATGYANKMNALANDEVYDPADNEYPHLADWTAGNGGDFQAGTATGGSDQYEMLYCWGCHKNNAGGIRAPEGETTLDYTYNAQPVVIPDLEESNACINCHVGWGSAGPYEVNTDSRGPFHHFAGGAILFNEETHIGGEFPGLVYTNGYFHHDEVGLPSDYKPDDPGRVFSGGPCVGCHMGTDADHTWQIIKEDEEGDEYVAEATTEFCSQCHPESAEVTLDFLEEQSDGYEQAGELLDDLVNNVVTNFKDDVIDDGDGANAVLALINNKLVSGEGDPGGYAHNRIYVMRLLFDSIDYLEDGSIDGTISDRSGTYPEAMAWFDEGTPFVDGAPFTRPSFDF